MTNQQAENEIRQRESRRFEAMVRGDMAALEEILSDDLTYTHASGAHESKTQFLTHLKSSQVKYQSFSPEDMLVRVYGTTGVVTGGAYVEVLVRGERNSFRLRFTDVYVKKDDRWQMVAWQATRLTHA